MEPIEILEKPTVLVVDDTPDNLTLMSFLLKDTYKVKVANHGEKALRIASIVPQPDIILLDIMMPEMDGYEVCRQLQQNTNTRNIPVIFLTSMSSTENEALGLELGAVDYITKPINPSIVLARIETHLKLKASADFLRSKGDYLEQEIDRRTREIIAIQDVTIQAMASLAETRDSDTGQHIRRTQFYVQALATRLKNHPAFSHYLTDSCIKQLFKSAPLHDIGKVGIPDRILLKPGRFEPHEFDIMKEHARLGMEAIEHAEQTLGMHVEFLRLAKEIAFTHHEKWDGSGYPQGLCGAEIPISGRLMAVADVYDALISRRIYKSGMPHEKAVEIMAEGKGHHFDPDIIEAFLAIQDEFQLIARRYADSDQDMEKKQQYMNQSMNC